MRRKNQLSDDKLDIIYQAYHQKVGSSDALFILVTLLYCYTLLHCLYLLHFIHCLHLLYYNKHQLHHKGSPMVCHPELIRLKTTAQTSTPELLQTSGHQ